MMVFDADDESVFFGAEGAEGIARAASSIARAAGMAPRMVITFFPSLSGGTAFVTSITDGTGGSLEERYIYRFDDMKAFLSACREAGDGSTAMTDGESFFISFDEDTPIAGEFGGRRQSGADLAKLEERLSVLNTDTKRLGKLAL